MIERYGNLANWYRLEVFEYRLQRLSVIGCPGCQSPEQLEPIRTSQILLRGKKASEWPPCLSHELKQQNERLAASAAVKGGKWHSFQNWNQPRPSVHSSLLLGQYNMLVRSKGHSNEMLWDSAKSSSRKPLLRWEKMCVRRASSCLKKNGRRINVIS